MIVESIDSEIRFLGGLCSSFFALRLERERATVDTLPLQNIHKLTKHTSKISSSSRFIHKTFIQVYRYVTHQHLVFVLRERRRASYFLTTERHIS